MDISVPFDHDRASVQRLRRTVARALAADVPVPVVEAILLLTSELVTNAILHAPPPFSLHLLHTDHQVRLSVTDGRGEGDISLQHPGPTEPGGRGLLLVDALASGWGVDETPTSRTVWFDLRY